MRLNASISSNTFSSTLSRALGTAVTVKGSYSRYSGDPTTDIKDPSTLSKDKNRYLIPFVSILHYINPLPYRIIFHLILSY